MDKYRIVVVPLVGGAPPTPLRLPGRPRLAGHLHDARGDGHVREAMEDAIKSGVPETPDPIPAYPAEVTM